jgi:hypothetical protein
MGVIVRHRRMTMKVRMGLGRSLLTGLVDMIVMGVVVPVAVFMDELGMVVHVPM